MKKRKFFGFQRPKFSKIEITKEPLKIANNLADLVILSLTLSEIQKFKVLAI